jgi:hypothetical protein
VNYNSLVADSANRADALPHSRPIGVIGEIRV